MVCDIYTWLSVQIIGTPFYRSQLPGVNVAKLVDEEPFILHADIPTVLANIRRILPGVDPVQVLVGQPNVSMAV